MLISTTGLWGSGSASVGLLAEIHISQLLRSLRVKSPNMLRFCRDSYPPRVKLKVDYKIAVVGEQGVISFVLKVLEVYCASCGPDTGRRSLGLRVFGKGRR